MNSIAELCSCVIPCAGHSDGIDWSTAGHVTVLKVMWTPRLINKKNVCAQNLGGIL